MDVGISDLLLAPESEVQTSDFACLFSLYLQRTLTWWPGQWTSAMLWGAPLLLLSRTLYHCTGFWSIQLQLIGTKCIYLIFMKILYYQFSNEEFLFSCSKTACSSARISFSRSRVSFSSASISSSIVCWGFLVLVLHFLLLGFLLFFLGFGLFVLLVPFS